MGKSAGREKREGSPGKRRAKANPVASELGCLRAPTYLTGMARYYWQCHAAELAVNGVLSSWDVGAFEMLCESYATWRRCQAETKRRGFDPIMRTSTGYEQEKPIMGVMRKARADYERGAKQFGLTPLARQGLDVSVAQESERDRFLGRKSGARAGTG